MEKTKLQIDAESEALAYYHKLRVYYRDESEASEYMKHLINKLVELRSDMNND